MLTFFTDSGPIPYFVFWCILAFTWNINSPNNLSIIHKSPFRWRECVSILISRLLESTDGGGDKVFLYLILVNWSTNFLFPFKPLGFMLQFYHKWDNDTRLQYHLAFPQCNQIRNHIFWYSDGCLTGLSPSLSMAAGGRQHYRIRERRSDYRVSLILISCCCAIKSQSY